MKIAVVGTGYVGLVTGTCFADSGNEVTCVDINKAKVDALNRGEIPIYEPGLAELVEHNVEAKRLTFTTDLAAAVKPAEVVYLAVGTPQGADGGGESLGTLERRRIARSPPAYGRSSGHEEHRAGRHLRANHQHAPRVHRPRLRRGEQPRVPQRGRRDRRLHEARSRGGRRASAGSGRHSAPALPAVPANRKAVPLDVARERRDDEVRRQRPAIDENQLHQRDGEPLRADGGRHQRRPSRHRARQPHWLRVSLPRRRLRRQLFPERRPRLGGDGGAARVGADDPAGRRRL